MAQRGATKHRSVEDWLKAPPPGKGGGGSGGKYLSGAWRDQGHIDFWMHPKFLPMAIWRHQFPVFKIIEDKNTGDKVKHVWTDRLTCHETDDVLARMYFREERGNPRSPRSTPPERCGMCKFNEWLWLQCWDWIETHHWDAAGKKWAVIPNEKPLGIDPCAIVFRFVSDEDKENRTMHAGGICGLFGKKELPEDLLAAMSAAKIHQTEAWKESTVVKAESVICGINNDKPGDGCQISIETKDLGEKMKEEITKVWVSLERHIQKNPYCVRWEYDKDKAFDKKYKVTAILKMLPGERIENLLKGPPPDTSKLEEPYNQQTMRALMEEHCRLKNVPWDDIFPSRKQEEAWREEDERATEAQPDQDDEPVEADDDSPAPVFDAEGNELVGCDCGKVMRMIDPVCPHCGKVYEVAAAEPEPVPEKPMRTRSEAMRARQAAAPAPSHKNGTPQDDHGPVDENEIPF